MFLGTYCPERIIALIEQYPYFEELYRDAYVACRNTERGMYMFSEELKILDGRRITAELTLSPDEDKIRA